MKKRMKKRIWNQLRKAAMVTVLAGIVGNCAVSAAEFETQEFAAPEVLLQQSAEWTDEKNFRAELRLDVSGLKKLYEEEANTAPAEGETKNETDEGQSTADEAAVDETAEQEDTGEEEVAANETEAAETAEGVADENTEQQEQADEAESEGQEEEKKTEQDTQPEKKYYLTAYISEYFQVDESGLKHDMQAESVKIHNQKGTETEITKLTCEVPKTDEDTDIFTLRMPVSLREEYCISPVAVSYPVCQDAPLDKDQNTAGVYFWQKSGDEGQILSVSSSAYLNVAESKARIAAELQQATAQLRGGQNTTYVLIVQNTGELPLADVEVDSTFSMNDVKASWEQEEGFAVKGTQGILTRLQAGESRKLRMTLQLSEDQSGELIHTVTVKAKHPGKDETIGCQAVAKAMVEALKAAFEVEKTADRTQAYPGDTITYQICIRNTGERTLHSVLSTERFQNAGIQAKFVQKEGVTLNSTGTQALIPQIAPGEAFALYATVTVPQYVTSQELINEVTVTSDETGTQTMKSQSNVTLTGSENTATVTPQPTAAAIQSYGNVTGFDSKSGGSYAAASKPRTGDETETALYIVLGIFAVMSGLGAFCCMKGKKQS